MLFVMVGSVGAQTDSRLAPMARIPGQLVVVSGELALQSGPMVYYLSSLAEWGRIIPGLRTGVAVVILGHYYHGTTGKGSYGTLIPVTITWGGKEYSLDKPTRTENARMSPTVRSNPAPSAPMANGTTSSHY